MSGGLNIIGRTLEETILSSWRTANTLVTNAQCALHWDKDRCWHYDPKLDDHMVASSSISSLSRSVVKTLHADEIPEDLRRCKLTLWYQSSAKAQRILERDALAWVAASLSNQ